MHFAVKIQKKEEIVTNKSKKSYNDKWKNFHPFIELRVLVSSRNINILTLWQIIKKLNAISKSI